MARAVGDPKGRVIEVIKSGSQGDSYGIVIGDADSMEFVLRHKSDERSAIPKRALPIKELLEPPEVMAILRISKRTLQRYVHDRKLDTVKKSGQLRFRQADVERFIQKRTVPAL